jgi:hypothetical protein
MRIRWEYEFTFSKGLPLTCKKTPLENIQEISRNLFKKINLSALNGISNSWISNISVAREQKLSQIPIGIELSRTISSVCAIALTNQPQYNSYFLIETIDADTWEGRGDASSPIILLWDNISIVPAQYKEDEVKEGELVSPVLNINRRYWLRLASKQYEWKKTVLTTAFSCFTSLTLLEQSDITAVQEIRFKWPTCLSTDEYCTQVNSDQY